MSLLGVLVKAGFDKVTGLCGVAFGGEIRRIAFNNGL
jgi:hypothetical protein